jgi:phosphatidate cytidylyltransferase
MSTDNNWHDLKLRLVSASFLLFISAFCIYFGNYVFTLFIISLIGVIHWELGKMLSPMSLQAMWFSAFLSMFLVVCLLASNSVFWPVLFLLINFYFQRHFFHHSRNFGAFYSLAVIVCGIIFYRVRLEFGLYHTIWLIGIVVVTDTAGYLIGRIIGGPKVFPRISPKKTWAGVLAGWFAVALFSWLFVENIAPQSLFIKFISISILLSVSAQIGDMIQSHLKRKNDVKDSSGLLPGHGGFMDRFDGFVGAMVVTGLIFEWIY